MLKKITAILILAVMMPLNIYAQFTLSGNIIDKENHEPLVGAHISVKELDLIVISDENGYFIFENIRKGIYLFLRFKY